MTIFFFLLNFRYPREKDQGVAFEKKIASADLVMFFDCQDVNKTKIQLLKKNLK